MFEIGIIKHFKFVVVGGALLLTVGCAQQTVKSDESVASASSPSSGSRSGSSMKEGSMTEAERRRKRDAFKRSLREFQNAPVYFDFDKSGIRPDMRPVLDRKAQFLLDFPSVRIQVEGHCDERGTAEYNVALGHRRAQQTKDYLVSLGVSASRVDTVSYGEERPADPRSHELAWAKNRRAMFNAIGGIPSGLN
ncbi:MAG: peptidoglycan-associated lipoprotein Pal [Nitrospinaceae bacterium]|jgi:peptidoglycan-associated lipoprotein|nr:peptidoglycan-associated lipoprotein Pal [Nitrospinaceae bacterium]MBT3433883.1 peptidoglycan-associated lipoprotein Pal [Nitrospinaceae bacterium]MBT3823179.1 peptidoglycan-associated lipoprotein Pal [Nitrospinaceae bacterium]MBT4429024.1 peptidoglycan-associated lipoprotein Pal [Nitrospinaceae bacterium]MBT5368638.1 peptidoglycan-associated lipoprotein Pal [Nitrospinaceae bacterium]